MYYNTTNETGETLKDSQQKAETQTEKILRYYRRCDGPRTPSEVFRFFRNWPITSIRRAITDLTNEGSLEKLDKKKMGMYGKPEHYWQAVRNTPAAAQAELFTTETKEQ